ncbi:MAG: PepSY-associated TM helix domain-containing protein [Pseudomonadales bacterium]|nr:PepSY-associated TM helix domain-containing protein [Pseudomonadales bacterium]
MMNSWQRWLRAPQTLGFRKLLFQVHLWLGIGFGLYVLVISLSGGALLLKSPFYRWFEPKTVEPLDVSPLEGEALTARMVEVYAGYDVGFTVEGFTPGDATYVVLQKDGEYIPHYFNQYTGEDIGKARPWSIQAVEWLADVHDDLLLGRRLGRGINGVGGALFVLMSCTGLLLWWRGRARWAEGLLIRRHGSRGLLWQLHGCIGFWSLLLMIAWGVSGFQLGFPRAMNAMLSWFGAEPGGFGRPSGLLGFFRQVHFAQFGEGAWAQWAWILASFLPTLLFASGIIVWWRRVVSRRSSAGKTE